MITAAPSFISVPEYRWTRGDDAARLCHMAGLVLDPWQRIAIDAILGEREDGRPAAFESCIIIARQNGKGTILEALSLYWLFVAREPLIMHSAHEFKTAAEAFRRIRTLIMGCPELSAEVKRITTAAGNEAIELWTGERLRYVARSKGSGRGFTAGKIILDEAYALSAEEMAALLPTMATRPNGQVVYTSSAGMASSTQLHAIRHRGHAGGDPSLAYLEWGGEAICRETCLHALDDPQCKLNDRALWVRANPRVSVEFIANERRALPAPEFARERMGIWDEPAQAETTIPLATWAAQARSTSAVSESGRPVFAVDVSPDRRSAAIGVCGRRPDGGRHIGLVDHSAGVEWIIPRLLGLIDRHDPIAIVLDGASPAAALLPALEAEGLRYRTPATPGGLLVVTSAADMGQACGGLLDALRADDGGISHRGDPILTSAWRSAVRRPLGDGLWGLGRRLSGGDITPAVVVTLAHWGHVVYGESDYALSDSFG